MKNLGPLGRKILKTTHLVMVWLWVGGAVGLLLMLSILGPGGSGQELYAYDVARKFVDDFLIIPGAMGALLTGLLFSLFTPWRFMKHHWVAVKWVLTVSCVLFGIFYLGPKVNSQPLISQTMHFSALNDPVYVANKLHNLLGGCLQVTILLFMFFISVLKPWGTTKHKNLS